MALGLVVAARNAHLDDIRIRIDAGATAGFLRVYDGVRPATGGVATVLLAELTFTDPAAPAAASGVLTFSAIAADTAANATGTASWCRLVDSTGAFVADGSVGATGADYNLNTTAITMGVQVSCTSASLTTGNP